MSAADIHVQISNVKTHLRYSPDDTSVAFETARWSRRLSANEINGVLVTANKTWVELVSDHDSVNPRSTRPRKFCVASHDPSDAEAVFECFNLLVHARVYDFRKVDHSFSSWGYESKLFAYQDRMCIAMPDMFKVFTGDDVGGVLLSRAGGGARTFDVCITLKNSGEYTLENVDNSQYAPLMELLSAEGQLSSESDECEDCTHEEEWHEGCTDEDSISDGPLSSEESEAESGSGSETMDSECTHESDCD